jgi:DNA polymerase-1
MSKGKVILVDGNSLLYRAFFAMPHFSTLENQPTNAVYGFAMMMLKLFETEKPDILLVAFDAPVKTFRHREYSYYKAHRKPPPDELKAQGPLAREMASAFNVPVIEIPGFEADDIVGTLARKAENEGYDVIIVTGDMDALQLVDEHVKVMTTVKGVTETVIYDAAAVKARYGVTPEQFADYKALTGDKSDNIPGVAGVGPVSASKLISEYGSLENLLNHLQDLKPSKMKENLLAGVEDARTSRYLAAIVTDVPIDVDLDECSQRNPDPSVLAEIFRRLEFRSLIKRIPGIKPEEEAATYAPVEEAGEVCTIKSAAELRPVLNKIKKDGRMVLALQGSSPHWADAKIIGAAVSPINGPACCISLDDIDLSMLKEVLESEDITKIGYNQKYHKEVLQQHGICLGGLGFDIMLAAYLLNPARASHALSDIASHYAGIEIGAEPQGSLFLPGLEDSAPEADTLALEADAVRRLLPILCDRLKADNLLHLMDYVEMPLVPILAEMEMTGVAVDTAWLEELSNRLAEGIAALEQSIYNLAGTEFNIGSPKQLQTILFEKLNLPATKKTKTGYSTDAETLSALAPAHEIVSKILEYRELAKLKSTYADALPRMINPRTGRIHTSLNQAVTTTGRLSSSEPNLQNIPVKTEIGREIRKAFIASPGNLLVSADYSQIELRILAHVSRDPALTRAYREGADIHTRTASRLFEVPVEDVTPDMRRQAKTVNFAVIYGMSDYGLSRELGIPPGVAKRYIESYFKEYSGVKEYAARTLDFARENGYVESLMDRRRYIPELNSPNRSIREFAERAAVNMPIQGTAADIVKLAMIKVYGELQRLGFKAKLVLQVHDELVFDVPEAETEALVPLITECMESAYKLEVPLSVEVKCGKDWCNAQSVAALDEPYIQA